LVRPNPNNNNLNRLDFLVKPKLRPNLEVQVARLGVEPQECLASHSNNRLAWVQACSDSSSNLSNSSS
jgi:hypothetical protein